MARNVRFIVGYWESKRVLDIIEYLRSVYFSHQVSRLVESSTPIENANRMIGMDPRNLSKKGKNHSGEVLLFPWTRPLVTRVGGQMLNSHLDNWFLIYFLNGWRYHFSALLIGQQTPPIKYNKE